jgi:hypothetical protein
LWCAHTLNTDPRPKTHQKAHRGTTFGGCSTFSARAILPKKRKGVRYVANIAAQKMGAQQLEDCLGLALARVGEDEDVGIVAAQTFEQAGVRWPYHGLVVRMRDGSEYQLPIMPSGLRSL